MSKKKPKYVSFEESIDQINNIINIHVSKWNLKGLAYIDKEDVASIIRIHIYNQWGLYDQNRPLGNWLTTTVKNRLKNLFRDYYYKFSSPCLNCPAFLGNNECKIFGEVSNQCGLYKKWESTKKYQYDVELPLTIENQTRKNEVHSIPFSQINFDEQIEELKHKLENNLSETEYKMFVILYLEKKTEQDILNEIKFKNKTDANRQIKNFKKSIFDVVKNIIINEDLTK